MFRYGVVAGFLLVLLFSFAALAQEGERQYSDTSMIIEIEGSACLGQDHTRVQTQRLAMTEAKRNASESVLTHVKSETNVKDGMLGDDIIKSYSEATVKVLKELEKGWAKSDASGGFVDDCYSVRIKAEVVPAKYSGAARPEAVAAKLINDPMAPLTIELWTEKKVYRVGDEMKFFFRGNKPFYAHAVYIDADGNHIKVTGSGKARYFEGGSVYEIPGDRDDFTLRITPPLGKEKLVLYTSTQPINNYRGKKLTESLFAVSEYPDLDETTRGLAILEGKSNSGKAEFAEARVDVLVEE